MSSEYTPRRTQEIMARHLMKAEPGLALHAGCGVGKTVTVATHMVEALEDRFDIARWLVVAPKTVAEETWQREFAKWRHLEHIQPRLISFSDLAMVRQRDEGTGRVAGLAFADKKLVKQAIRRLKAPVQVCGYGVFPWLVSACGVNFPFDGVVFDESPFLKDTTTERFKAAKKAVRKLGLVKEVIELCGTPIANGYEDLMGQFVLLDGGARLGENLTQFRENWSEPLQRGKGGTIYSWGVKDDALPHIQRKIGELAVSVDHDTGVELVESCQIITLPPKARKAYDDMREKLVIEIEQHTILSANAAVLRGKCLQIANGYVKDIDGEPVMIHTAKVDAVVEAVEAATGPVMLGYLYRADERALSKRLGARMRLASQPGAMDLFRTGKLPVLGFHPENLSYGLDGFQDVCDTIFWFTPPDRYDWYHQVYKRVQRSGQKSGSVFVRMFIADRTIEAGIIEDTLVSKGQRNDGLLRALRVS